MSGIIVEGFQLFFEDARGRRILLADTAAYADNESKALLHYIDDDYVWVMRDNLKNITDYIERDTTSGASLRAALTVLAVRELLGKCRPRRILWMGEYHRAAIGITKMLPIFHDENRIYAVFPDFPDDIEKNVVPIRVACDSLPLPEEYYDIVVVDFVDVTSERMAQLLLSLRVGGVFLLLLSAGADLSYAIPDMAFISDDDGNTLVQVRMTKELAAVVREGTAKGRLDRQKRLISYILDELGDTLGAVLANDDDMCLEAAVTQAALAEDNILPIYEELISEDIKYLANRFKESLIEFRMHRSEKARTRVFEEYIALRREMRECDDF